MSSSGAVQRRGLAQQQQPPPPLLASAGSSGLHGGVDALGLRTWHLWMLFGLGWPSVLLFFLSTISAFPAKTQGLLLTFGWIFCACWWAVTASGILTTNPSRRQQTVYTASFIVTGIGSLIGAVFSVSYAYYNWPWLYIAATALVIGGVLFVVSNNSQGSSAGPANGEDAGAQPPATSGGTGAQPATGGAAAAATAGAGQAGAVAVGDLIDLKD